MEGFSGDRRFIDHVNGFTDPRLLEDWAIGEGCITNYYVVIRIRQLEIYLALNSRININATWTSLVRSYLSKDELLAFALRYNLLHDEVVQRRIQEIEKVYTNI